MSNNTFSKHDELPLHRPPREVRADWAVVKDGCSDAALDNLCCGVTTCRDDDGVVWPDRLQRLTPEQLERVANCGEYSEDEVYAQPSPVGPLNLSCVDHGYVNQIRIRDTSGGQWRDLVAAGLPVERAPTGLLFDLLRQGIEQLPPHLRHALELRPHVASAAAARIAVALRHGG